MTGFGRTDRLINGLKISIEIRSVNHRYHEIMFKMPKDLLVLEDQMKKIIKSSIKRGRVDVFVTLEVEESPYQRIKVDWNLVNQYMNVIKDFREQLDIDGQIEIRDLLNIPDLIHIGQDLVEIDHIQSNLLNTLEEACHNLLQMRNKEGANLYDDLISRIGNLEKFLEQMKLRAPYVVEDYRSKLKTRISEWLTDVVEIDETRLLNEIAFFTDKANIDEEIIRLKSHFKQFLIIIDEKEPVGRKLDFLIQEMNREVNTVGSKANDLVLSQLVVEMKSELEKIREQVQNVE